MQNDLSSAIIAAAVGATTVITVDLVDSILETRLDYGATHTANSAYDDLAERI